MRLLLSFTDLLPESARTQRMHTISAREACDPFAVLQTINGPCPESVSVGCRKEFGMSIADRSIAATMATIPSVSPYTMRCLLLTLHVGVRSTVSRQVGCWLEDGTFCPLSQRYFKYDRVSNGLRPVNQDEQEGDEW